MSSLFLPSRLPHIYNQLPGQQSPILSGMKLGINKLQNQIDNIKSPNLVESSSPIF